MIIIQKTERGSFCSFAPLNEGRDGMKLQNQFELGLGRTLAAEE